MWVCPHKSFGGKWEVAGNSFTCQTFSVFFQNPPEILDKGYYIFSKKQGLMHPTFF